MILTGKAKEDFLTNMSILTEIKDKKYLEEYFSKISDLIKNAYYVDFFDSVGIYIFIDNVSSYKERFWRFHIAMNDLDRNIREEFYMDNRSEITYKAIKKANEIYNEKYSISQ